MRVPERREKGRKKGRSLSTLLTENLSEREKEKKKGPSTGVPLPQCFLHGREKIQHWFPGEKKEKGSHPIPHPLILAGGGKNENGDVFF